MIRTVKQNEFEPSREHGKLVFKVKNSASATPDVVKSYKFQEKNIPTTLYLVQNSDGTWEQAMSKMLEQNYQVGQAYKFTVLNMAKTGTYSLIDDTTGLAFSQIKLGQHKFNQYDRILCKVLELKGDTLGLEYLESTDNEEKKYFTEEKLIEMRQGDPSISRALLNTIFGSKIFGDAAAQLEDHNSEWIVTLLEAAINSLPVWVNRPMGRTLLTQVRDLAIKLIEQSDFMNFFPIEERSTLHVRLSEVIEHCEDYLNAYQLIKEEKHIEFVNNILHPLKTSGWLYKPDKKMRRLMALFTQRNELAGQYIDDIFSIIKENHGDSGFTAKFGQMFINMLRIYIDTESKVVSDSERDTLLSLIEATAILLLLNSRSDLEAWDAYRGKLYSMALLLNRQPSASLINKALASFAGTLNQPLEYGWNDLSDPALMCSGKLAMEPLHPIALGQSKYEQGNMQVELSGGDIRLSNREQNADKVAFDINITPEVKFEVTLDSRLSNHHNRTDHNLSHQHLLWNEIERHLKETFVLTKKTTQKLVPDSGEEVRFIITGKSGNYEYDCLLIDEMYSGCRGTLNWIDVMALPLEVPADKFRNDKGYLVYEGSVMGVMKDGLVRLSIAKVVAEEVKSLANQTKDSQENIDAIITKGGDSGCLAYTYDGYTVCIPSGTFVEGQKVSLQINKIKMQANCRVYVEASLVDEIDILTPEDAEAENIESAMVMLESLAEKEEYTLQEAEELEQSAAKSVEVRSISSAAIHHMAWLLEILAMVEQSTLIEEYSLLAMSRVLMLATLDTYRARIIELKMSMLEEVSKFGYDVRIDNQKADSLIHQVMTFRASDRDLQRRMTLLKVLASLDRPGLLNDKSLPTDPSDTSVLGKVTRLAVAYNSLRFLQLNDVRKQLLASIITLLNLPKPKVDSTKLNVVEDQYNEFKSSIIYPAGNSMQPDERKQSREICEVICGMMNADGGTLYIGVNNSGVPTGLESDFLFINHNKAGYDQTDMEDKFKLRFTYALRHQLGLYVEGRRVFPDYVSIEFDELDGKRYAVVSVKKFTSHDKVRLTDGTAWLRQDTSTLPILKK